MMSWSLSVATGSSAKGRIVAILFLDVGANQVAECFLACVICSYLPYRFLESYGLSFAGSNLKKIRASTDDAVLSDIRVALSYFGRRSLHKQGRAAHVLLCYEPTYTTFSAAENIPIPEGEDFLVARIFSDFKNLRRVGFEGSDSDNTEVSHTAESDQSEAESEEVLDSADPRSDRKSVV